MNLRLCRQDSGRELIRIVESNLAVDASDFGFVRAPGSTPTEGNWYFRCFGEDGGGLASLEIRGGQLMSIELVSVSYDPSLLHVARSMQYDDVDFRYFLSLEPTDTRNVRELIGNGVDVHVRPTLAREGNRLILGLNFEQARKMFREPDGTTYFVDEQMILAGIGFNVGG